MKLTYLLLTLATALSIGQTPATLRPDPPHKCADCDEWNKPHEPFRVFGNTYYVGVDGLSAVLIAGTQGSILLDGGLPQSAPLIDANIRKLGFRTEDIKLIVNSHAHYDHAGGIAAIQRASGAVVAASPAGAKALERGEPTPDDPQYAFGREVNAFPALKGVRTVSDGETLRVGDLAVTAHLTPGHTPGATTWTWRSCEGARPSTGCYNIVYADSLNAVSASAFRFTGDATHPSLIETFRATIAKVRALPCDIVIGVHPGFTDLAGKLKRRLEKPARDPFVTPDGCRAYANGAAKRLDARIAEEARLRLSASARQALRAAVRSRHENDRVHDHGSSAAGRRRRRPDSRSAAGGRGSPTAQRPESDPGVRRPDPRPRAQDECRV